MKKVLTLCIVREPSRVLLGMKKIKFGKGFWNGFGGHVQEGETIEEAARREVKEEAGITVGAMEEVGVINFVYEQEAGEPKEMEVHIFSAKDFTGEPTESDEMIPHWFPIAEIPYETMWPSDVLWHPMFLKGESFAGVIIFDRHGKIREHNVTRRF